MRNASRPQDGICNAFDRARQNCIVVCTNCSSGSVFDEGENVMVSKTPDPIDKYVGSRIRMRRIMLGMSQEKLGDALGLTFQQVQKYEKGTNRVGASRLQQIADVLQVHVSFMFEGAPGGAAGGGMNESASPASEQPASAHA